MTAAAFPVADDDDRVAVLFERLGWRIASAEPITTLPLSGSRRFAYRVTLTDGRVVKLRRLKRREHGARAIAILHTLADDRFAAVRVVADDLVIEEWIEGTPLAAGPPRREHVDCAATILAKLHRTRDVAGWSAGHTESTAPVVAATLARLRRFDDEGLIAPAMTGQLMSTVERRAPAAAHVGITHNDFCGANMVIDVTGALRIVDNEGIAVGFLDYDLARTWYRWDLDGPLWQTFVASYLAAGGPVPDAHAAPFWRIAATAKSAEVRARGTSTDLEHALVMLRRLSG